MGGVGVPDVGGVWAITGLLTKTAPRRLRPISRAVRRGLFTAVEQLVDSLGGSVNSVVGVL